MSAEIDTGNNQLVGVHGDRIVVMHPKTTITKQEALRHAAWLVSLAGGREAFLPVLDAVEST